MHARTMALLEFGCPPMPVANGKRMETDEPAIINSHDLLSVFLAQAFKQQDDKFNETRKEKQKEIQRIYHQDLTSSENVLNSTYFIMAKYTRSYLSTYLLPPFTAEDIHVLPPDCYSPPLMESVKDYTKGLRILHEENAQLPSLNGLENHFLECKRLQMKKVQYNK